MTLTLAKLYAEKRAGVVHVSFDAYTDILTNTVSLRMYAPAAVDHRNGLTFYGPFGEVTLRPREDLQGDEHEWSESEPTITGSLRRTYTTGIPEMLQAQRCSYCGAPGQRIGSRCEYCQVFVSREVGRSSGSLEAFTEWRIRTR